MKPEGITFKESPSAQRETLIQNGEVDYIVATYSITDARKEKVGFAGPYFIAGQSLLVRSDNTDITGRDSLSGGKKLCSVTGSTPAQKVKDSVPDVQLQEFDTYSACVEALRNGAVDAVTTDDIILAGFAAQYPGQLKVVGEPFTTENYGVGLAKDDSETRGKINDAIEKMISTGAWKKPSTTPLALRATPSRRRPPLIVTDLLFSPSISLRLPLREPQRVTPPTEIP